MTHFETVHTENFAGFEIALALAPEDMAPDWDFESEEDRQNTMRKIDNGSLLWFVARVTASRAGVTLGTDYLGGCCYESVRDFLQDAYYADMIDAAVKEARETIAELQKEQTA